jgi:sirohydrochlorin cobaltochelatase
MRNLCKALPVAVACTAWLTIAGLAGCATSGGTTAGGSGNDAGEDDDRFGVLVMAHGGSRAWDEAVLAVVEPLRGRYPLEVAFGMADAASMQDAVDKLEVRGVSRIGVVRLFVNGDSFRDRTEQILGLSAGAPARPHARDGDHAQADHRMEFWRVETSASFVMSGEGLNEAPEVGAILLDRVRSLSRDPEREDVLVLAHGAGDDVENEFWLERIGQQGEQIRRGLQFRSVRIATLREDWPEKRAPAEAEIRGFLEASSAAGRTTIVVPYRVHGFGPYASVLEGLDYVADGQGLLPHTDITAWIARQAEALRRVGGEPAP